MASNVTAVYSDRERWRVDWTDDTGRRRAFTRRGRAVVEAHRAALLGVSPGADAPAPLGPPPPETPGSAQWWSALLVEGARLAREALGRRDVATLAAVRKYSAALDGLARSATLHSNAARLEDGFRRLLDHVRATAEARREREQISPTTLAELAAVLDGPAGEN